MEGNQGNQPAAGGGQRNAIAAAVAVVFKPIAATAAAVIAPRPPDSHLFLALSLTTNFIWLSAWALATPIGYSSGLHFHFLSYLVSWAIDFLFFCGVRMLRSPQNNNQNLQLEQPRQEPSPADLADVVVLGLEMDSELAELAIRTFALFQIAIFIWVSAWVLATLFNSNPDFVRPDFAHLVHAIFTLAWKVDVLFSYGVGDSLFVGLVTQFLALIVTANFIGVSAWVLVNLINSNPDFAPLVPFSVVVAWAIDVLFFCCFGFQLLRLSQNNNQNLKLEQPQKPSPAGQVQKPSKRSCLTKDLCKVISLIVGLGIPQHLNAISFTSFVLWISCLARVIICFLIVNHPEDYGFIDLFITLLIQSVVYFIKEKRIGLLLQTSVLCVGLVTLRNCFDEVSIYFNKTKRIILSYFEGL